MKVLGYLLAANFETVAIFLLSWKIGQYLNTHFPQNFNWQVVCIILGLAVIIHSWVVLFRSLMRDQGKKKS